MRLLPLAVLVIATQALADLPPPEVVLPADSADYRKTVRTVLSNKHRPGGALKREVVALKLKPHPLGCEYYFLTPPPPPPGITFEAKSMPSDWVGTFGEVAMVHLGGWGLSREEYDALHKAAHGTLPGFPNCGQPTPKK